MPPDPRAEGLIAALMARRFDEALDWLARGADPDARSRPYAALHHAALSAHTALVLALLDAGADVDVRSDYHDRSPLHYVVGRGGPAQLACARLLLARGADVNAIDHAGETPLHHAVRSQSEEMVQALFDGGAQIDRKTSAGSTPLAVAAREPAELVARRLLDLGADPSAVDECGCTPLHLAVRAYGGADTEAQEEILAIVKLLISRGADPDLKTTEELEDNPIGSTVGEMIERLDVTKQKRVALVACLRKLSVESGSQS